MRPIHPRLATARPPFGRPPGLPRDHARPLLYRLPPEAAEGPTGGELARDAALALFEAVLFAADEPLTARRLAALAGLPDAAEARRLALRLRDLLDRGGTAFGLEELAGGFQLLTRPEYHAWLAPLRREPPEPSLSPAARETLTIVAYRQPVTRADLEAVRGVGCGDMLRLLMDRGLVRIAGRDDSLGRPQLYGTTKKFLQAFGLRSLRDLPPAEGLTPSRGGKKGGAAEEGEGE